MNYNWKFVIPKETEEYTPLVKIKKVSYGVIRQVTIVNPSGSKGKSHLRIYFHEFQIYPLNKGEWYEGENINVRFMDYYRLVSPPYELKLKGWNESINHAHAFYINITVLKEENEGKISTFEELNNLRGEI